jgi:hypothetical protein
MEYLYAALTNHHSGISCARSLRGNVLGFIGALTIAVGLAFTSARAADPVITKIEKFGNNWVTIHFDTEANREYVLQYTDTLSCTTNSASCTSNGVPQDWKKLFTWKRSPFPNHFIISDRMTNRFRFYRLKVTP